MLCWGGNVFKRIASGALACVALAVSSRAATLSGTFTAVSAGTAVDLSSAGMEWAQWGLDTGVNRKAGVSSQIADVIVFGPNSSEMISNFPVLFNWTNGTPVQAGTNVTTALAVKGVGNGFAFTVPADLVKRKLRLYAGGAAAQMRVDATLSDASAAAFSDSSLNASSDGAAGVYDFDYSAASVGQTLNVSVTLAAASDETIGNVQLAAAILSSNLPPVVTITSPTNNVILTAPANVSVMLDAQDADGAISKVELYRSGSKIADLTNAPYSFLMTNL